MLELQGHIMTHVAQGHELCIMNEKINICIYLTSVLNISVECKNNLSKVRTVANQQLF